MNHDARHGYPTLNAFVDARIAGFQNTEHDFRALFDLMFSGGERVFYERSEGYRILRTTYDEAREETLRRAAALKARLPRLEQNAVVGLHLENSLSWLELFWAILLCGWRPLLMNLRLSREVLEQALADSGAGAVISQSSAFSVETVFEKDILPAEEPLAPGETGTELFVMSSGSSGSVKLCAYGAEEFYWQIHSSCDIVRSCAQVKKHYKGYLKQLTFLPFYHIFGLVAVYIWFAFFSCCFVQLNDLAPRTIVNTVRRHGVTHIFAVPLFWEKVYRQALQTIAEQGEKQMAKFRKGMKLADRLADAPLLGPLFSQVAFREVRREMFGDSVRLMISGGSDIAPEILSFFNNIGYFIANGYGMSEVGITSVELDLKKSLRSSALAGRPLALVEYRLTEGGELQIRSPAAARYIIENGETLPRQEWFSTQDLARCENGHYRILGRRDELVVSPSGENLSPGLIEPVFQVPGVAGTALISAREGSGNVPVLLVSVKRHATPQRLEELREELWRLAEEKKLAGQLGRLVFVANDLMGPEEFKLNRRLLAEKYTAGQLTVLTPQTCEEVFRQDDSALAVQVRMLFATALGLPPAEIADRADFFRDLGGASLDYLALVSQIQTEFGVSLSMEGEKSPGTVSEFCEWIRSVQESEL